MLPNLTDQCRATQAQVEHFRTFGWAAAPQLLTGEEVGAWQPYVADALARLWSPAEGKGGARDGAFRRVDSVWRQDEVVARLSLAPRIASFAADLLGCEAVRLYKDTIFYKYPGQGRSPWHQDHIATPIDARDAIVNCWIVLGDVGEQMGPLMYAEGSHHSARVAFGDTPGLEAALFKHSNWSGGERLQAGDANCHQGWTLHAADGNHGHRVRKAFSLMFVCDGARAASLEALAGRTRDDLDVWKRWFETGGLQYGRPVQTPLCPRAHPPSDEWRTAMDLPILQPWDI